MTSRRRQPYLHPCIWLVYAVLFVLAVPWYWGFLPIEPDRVWWGMPPWAFTAVAVSFVTSCYTCALLMQRWPDEVDSDGEMET